jgi:hypothetical protein
MKLSHTIYLSYVKYIITNRNWIVKPKEGKMGIYVEL